MPTALLIDNAAVRGRMAIGSDILGIDPAIESAIGAAQLRIQTELDSELQLAEHEDVFHLDPELMANVLPGGLFRLRLRSGLIRKDLPLTLSAGYSWSEATTAVDASMIAKVDYERGIVYLDQQTYTGQYVKVGYSSGFEAGDEIPEWLTEALLAYVPVVFNFGQPTNRSDEAEKGARMSGAHAMAILSRYTRDIGFVYRPVF